MSKQFRSTKVIVRCLEKGKAKTANEEAVAPKLKEEPVGTFFKATDFEKDEFSTYYNDGTLVEVTEGDGDAASAYYDTQTGGQKLTASGEVQETEEKRTERLHNEAKTLGVTGITKTMKADTIEAKIAEFKNKREDGTNASVQEGAGRANPSDGNGPAGGNAEGTAAGAKPPQGTSGDDKDVLG